MHEAAEGIQVGTTLVSTFGVGGLLFAAGNMIGRRRRAATSRRGSSHEDEASQTARDGTECACDAERADPGER
jgi:hypothetical protein